MVGVQGTEVQNGWRLWQQELISAGGWLGSDKPEGMKRQGRPAQQVGDLQLPTNCMCLPGRHGSSCATHHCNCLARDFHLVSAELAPHKLQTAAPEQMVVCLAAPDCCADGLKAT